MTVPAGRRRRALRDQGESPFAAILEDLLALVPFVRGAAIVDFEGETVDYAGELDPFELRVAAATLQLTLADIRECPYHGSAVQLSVCMGRAGYVLRALDPSYSLLMVLRKLGTFVVSTRVLLEIEARILVEAGLPIVRKPSLHRIDVETFGRGSRIRPARIRPAQIARPAGQDLDWMSVEVLGALVGGAPGERAFRVRLPTGAECTLLRESKRFWFSEEPIEALMRGASQTNDALFHPARS
ncbi:MAG: hypothetical protein HOW73_49955 [Polyangiaceae bacterium]|nr:hypothetical protein [Polyangiaceae bacterium]